MTDAEQQAALDRLRDFADQQREAGEVADRGSLERAADIVALYEDKAWVREVDPPKARRNRGRPVDPESFSRFTKWLAERVPLQGRQAYRLRDAHELMTNYVSGGHIIPAGEFVLRPLKWMVKQGHEDAISDVWKDACKDAGGPPTEEHVKRALKRWKDDNGYKTVRAPGAGGKRMDARAEAAKLRAEIERFMRDHPVEFVELWEVIDTEAREEFDHQEVAEQQEVAA